MAEKGQSYEGLASKFQGLSHTTVPRAPVTSFPVKGFKRFVPGHD